MTIKIVTDSSIQLTADERAKYDIHIVPLTIQQGNESFIDGQTITRAEFLSRLQNATTDFPTTSQPTVGSFVDLYDQLGADDSTILSIHCTGLLSGTIEGAHTAAHQSTSNVHVIDSKAIDRGLAYQVVAAAQDVEAGKPLDDIIAHLDDIRRKTETYVFLDSLDALQRGGRISRMVGLLTKIIKLKVIVRLTDTELEVVAKGRGLKAFTKEINNIRGHLATQDVAEIGISHVGITNELSAKIQATLEETQPHVPYTVALTSPVIMSHVGLGAFGIFYRTK
ncbi:DegV family protein [Latilactobacillus curvatus]